MSELNFTNSSSIGETIAEVNEALHVVFTGINCRVVSCGTCTCFWAHLPRSGLSCQTILRIKYGRRVHPYGSFLDVKGGEAKPK